MRRLLIILLIAVIAGVVGLGALISSPAWLTLLKRRLVFQVPEGYQGWVLIRMGDPRCSPPEITVRSITYRADKTGHGCTSAMIPADARIYLYEYRAADGRRIPLDARRPEQQVQAPSTAGPAIDSLRGETRTARIRAPSPGSVYQFFIGTADRLRAVGSAPSE